MFEGEASASLSDQAKVLMELTAKKKLVKGELDDLQQKINKEMEKLLAIMDDDCVHSLGVDGMTVFKKTVTYVSVNKARKTEALKWLRKNGYGSLVSESANSNTLTAVYSELTDAGIVMPEELFNINPKDSVGIRKGRKQKTNNN
jgi:predicted NodU family carbamoyl transferase